VERNGHIRRMFRNEILKRINMASFQEDKIVIEYLDSRATTTTTLPSVVTGDQI